MSLIENVHGDLEIAFSFYEAFEGEGLAL